MKQSRFTEEQIIAVLRDRGGNLIRIAGRASI